MNLKMKLKILGFIFHFLLFPFINKFRVFSVCPHAGSTLADSHDQAALDIQDSRHHRSRHGTICPLRQAGDRRRPRDVIFRRPKRSPIGGGQWENLRRGRCVSQTTHYERDSEERHGDAREK